MTPLHPLLRESDLAGGGVGAATHTATSPLSVALTAEWRPTPKYLRRKDSAAHVREQYGIPCSNAWLAKLATVGGGPVFRKAGRFPIYAVDDLDTWALSRIGKPVRSTSELSAGADHNVR